MSSLKDKYGRLSKNDINLIELGCIDKTDHVKRIYKNNIYIVLATSKFNILHTLTYNIKIFDINLKYLNTIYVSDIYNICLCDEYIIYIIKPVRYKIEIYSYNIKNEKSKLIITIDNYLCQILYNEYDSLVYVFHDNIDFIYTIRIKDSEIIDQTCDEIYNFNAVSSSIILSKISDTHYILNCDNIFLFKHPTVLYKINNRLFQDIIPQSDIIGTDYYNNILIYTSNKLIIFNENKIFIKKLTPIAVSNIILDDNKLIYVDKDGNLVTRVIINLYTEIK